MHHWIWSNKEISLLPVTQWIINSFQGKNLYRALSIYVANNLTRNLQNTIIAFRLSLPNPILLIDDHEDGKRNENKASCIAFEFCLRISGWYLRNAVYICKTRTLLLFSLYYPNSTFNVCFIPHSRLSSHHSLIVP